MRIHYCFQKLLLLHLSDEAEPGSGGDQPARNTLTGRNGKQGAKHPPKILLFYFSLLMPKKTHGFVRSQKIDVKMKLKNKLKNQLLT
jgi:hypothetical protein